MEGGKVVERVGGREGGSAYGEGAVVELRKGGSMWWCIEISQGWMALSEGSEKFSPVFT